MSTYKEVLRTLTKGALATQEEMLEVGHKKGSLTIGIPKEISFQENRIAMVPDDAALLINLGHRVLIETNAGKECPF